jgi:hypothetical protein
MKKYVNIVFTTHYIRNLNYAGGLSGSVIFSALNNDRLLAAKAGDIRVVEATFSVDDFTLAFTDAWIFEGDLADFESALDAGGGESLEPFEDFKDAEVHLLFLSPFSRPRARFLINMRKDLSRPFIYNIKTRMV